MEETTNAMKKTASLNGNTKETGKTAWNGKECHSATNMGSWTNDPVQENTTPTPRASMKASPTRPHRSCLLSLHPQRPGLDVNIDYPLCHGGIVSVSRCPSPVSRRHRRLHSTVPCPSVETILNYKLNDTAVAGPWNCRASRRFFVEILPGRPGHFCIFCDRASSAHFKN